MFTAITAKAVGRDASQSEREPEVIALDVSRPGAVISPTMFGVFFEDINFAADGGLYPERVKSKSFEFTEPLSGWRKPWRPDADGELIVLGEGGLNENSSHSLRLRTYSPGDRGFGVVNSGFRGMGVEAGAECTLLRADPEGRE